MRDALILTPGWMTTHSVWVHQAPLQERFKLITWDLPMQGAGGEPLTLDHCAQALKKQVTDLALTEAGYVGWSMGMSVFWRYLELFGSDPFVSLINVEMLPRLDPKETRVEQVVQSMRRDRERATRKFFGRAFLKTEESEMDALVAAALQMPLASVLSVYRDMVAADFTATATQFQGPQNIILGRQGFYAGREEAVRTLLPGQEIHWIDQAAHAPFWNAAEAFNNLVARLLK